MADVALLGLALALAALTVIVIVVPAVAPATVNDRFDIAIGTSAALVSLAVAALAWGRGRVAGDASALLRASAFTVLAMLNAIVLLAAITGADMPLGATLADPGQLPLIAAALGRGTCAVLLVVAGLAALRGWVVAPRPAVVVLGPAVLVLGLLALAVLAGDQVPSLASADALDYLARHPTLQLPAGSVPVLVLVHSSIAAVFLLGAWLAHRSFIYSRRAGDALLAAGLIIAAFSQVHGAIHPGSYATVVTSGDLLRLGFYLVLLLGVVADSRADLAQLRAANLEVKRLADAQVAAAALEERARLAREIHDGLAQDLWYAKLKQGRLAQVARLEGEPRQLSDEVADALDSALAEARHAVEAMREGSESGPLLDLLTRLVDDFGDRFAIRAELRTSGPPPEIGPRAQAEIVRIVQEALTNVRKHADATVVRVDVASDGDLRIAISDNGRGFQPEARSGGFGLDSMRQRAELIGAELTVTSRSQDGSRVELRMPLGAVREGSNGDG